ncbi:MAG: hypothetical protein AAF149_24490 [Bacteroidota bacterium]
MHTHTDKTQENKSQSVANSVTQNHSDDRSAFQFVNNRPEAIAQRKLQEMANNSPQSKQAAQLQAIAGNYYAKQHDTIQKKEDKIGLLDNLDTGLVNSRNKSIPIQLLKATDYTRVELNANGLTDLQNITNGLAAAIRANVAGMQWDGWWQHILDNNHNANPKVGDQSSFLGDTEDNIRGFAETAITNGNYYLTNGGMMVFESASDDVCNGSDSRKNVRVTINVNDVQDDILLADQIAYMTVTNSYPIA